MEYLAKLNALIDDYANFHLVSKKATKAYPKEYINRAIIFYCTYSNPKVADSAFEVIRNEVMQIKTYDLRALKSMLREILPTIQAYLAKHSQYFGLNNEQNNKVFWNMAENTGVLLPGQINTLLNDSVAKFYKPRCEKVIELINEVNLEIPKLLSAGQKARPKAKIYALLHLLKIEVDLAPNLPRTIKGDYDKKAIEAIAVDEYKFIDGQSFYRCITDPNIKDKTTIAREFKDGYKEIIRKLSGNYDGIIELLKLYPTGY